MCSYRQSYNIVTFAVYHQNSVEVKRKHVYIQYGTRNDSCNSRVDTATEKYFTRLEGINNFWNCDSSSLVKKGLIKTLALLPHPSVVLII